MVRVGVMWVYPRHSLFFKKILVAKSDELSYFVATG